LALPVPDASPQLWLRPWAVGLAAGGFAYLAYGQAARTTVAGTAAPGRRPPHDPRIAKAIEEVSADRIRQTIEKLVSFGTGPRFPRRTRIRSKPARHRAAREWIKAEFERYSKECGGCLEVKTDTFTEAPGERIAKRRKSPMFMRFCADQTRKTGRSHRAGHGPLRLAEQRHFQRDRPRSGSERRRQRHGGEPGSAPAY